VTPLHRRGWRKGAAIQIESLIQQIVNGLLLGMSYGVVGAGFAITYGISRVLNFAHGAFYVIGSYGVYALHDWLGMPLWGAFMLGSLFVLPAALFGYYIVIKPYGPERSGTALLGTFGVAIVIIELLRQIFGSRPLIVPRLIDRPPMTVMENVYIPYDQAAVAVFSLLVLLASLGLLRWTGIGRRLRAIVQSGEAAQLIGIRPEPYRLLSFVSGSWLAGVAGAGLAFLAPINTGNGVTMTFIAFVIVVLAGLGNVGGAVLVGGLVALLQALSALYVRPEVSIATPYLFMIAVLIIRPQGLFPTRA